LTGEKDEYWEERRRNIVRREGGNIGRRE